MLEGPGTPGALEGNSGANHILLMQCVMFRKRSKLFVMCELDPVSQIHLVEGVCLEGG
jgi:hypothetical protein